MNSHLLTWKMKTFNTGSALKEKNLLPWEQLLSFKNRPIYEGDKIIMKRVASPESVLIYL